MPLQDLLHDLMTGKHGDLAWVGEEEVAPSLHVHFQLEAHQLVALVEEQEAEGEVQEEAVQEAPLVAPL